VVFGAPRGTPGITRAASCANGGCLGKGRVSSGILDRRGRGGQDTVTVRGGGGMRADFIGTPEGAVMPRSQCLCAEQPGLGWVGPARQRGDRMAQLRWGAGDHPGAASGDDGRGQIHDAFSTPHRREECSPDTEETAGPLFTFTQVATLTRVAVRRHGSGRFQARAVWKQRHEGSYATDLLAVADLYWALHTSRHHFPETSRH
jgi:hypothetical protein